MRFFFVALAAFAPGASAQNVLIPDNLKPPAAEKLARKARASGDQIYRCDGTSWVLTGPDAKLFDDAGKQIGLHFAGPTWE